MAIFLLFLANNIAENVMGETLGNFFKKTKFQEGGK